MANKEEVYEGEINLRDPKAVDMWCEVFRVITPQLVEAVDEVGTSAQKVAEYLREKKRARARQPN